jgi:hypothetical protein
MNIRIIIYSLLFVSLILTGCKKEDKSWDARLNGLWIEVLPLAAKSLPEDCDLEFLQGSMYICNKDITGETNRKTRLYSDNGQIWINYSLAFKKHIEYRYDYEFDGDFLWLIENDDPGFTNVAGRTGAKKYQRANP